MKKLNSSFEGEIVQIYDDYYLPRKKVYGEVDYIIKMIKGHITDFDLCIDLGCGTGAYSEELSKFFKRVISVDFSKDMIEYAKNNHSAHNVTFQRGDARSMKAFGNDNLADLVVMLAHVIGYQLDNASVLKCLKTVNKNLKMGGLVFFNFYNLPAIYLNGLTPRRVSFSVGDKDITRLSNATNNHMNNCLDMDYYYLISEASRTNIYEIHEKIRYFSKLELELYINENGFEVIKFFNYNSQEELSVDCWNGGILAKKVTDV